MDQPSRHASHSRSVTQRDPARSSRRPDEQPTAPIGSNGKPRGQVGSLPKKNMETVNVELETYDLDKQKWSNELGILHHCKEPFAKGGMRNAYRAWNCKIEGWESHPRVLKMPLTPDLQNEDLVRTQVIMQAKCVGYAKQFNAEKCITKKISYVPCLLVKFLSGRWKDQYGCLEEYVEGNFEKHNTVHPSHDGKAFTSRNTPQAFSHYTFVKSGNKEIVVDVQGVGDTYTDPQLYSVSIQSPKPPFGPADWAITGVANFFKHHECNALCIALGLTPNRMKKTHTPIDTMPTNFKQPGTKPADTLPKGSKHTGTMPFQSYR